MNETLLRGQCLCGSIHYEAEYPSPEMAHCHCTMCRKFHGAAFSTYASVSTKNFRWRQGGHLLKTYKAPNGTKRGFCGRCGSSLTFESALSEGVIEFTIATLDNPPALAPDAHVFTSTKVNWINIDDYLPQHRQNRS